LGLPTGIVATTVGPAVELALTAGKNEKESMSRERMLMTEMILGRRSFRLLAGEIPIPFENVLFNFVFPALWRN
jgi:hypothetical protein